MEKLIFGIAVFEWVGYFASAVVLLSFLMKKMSTLRLVNTAGCLLFVLYGLVLPDLSIPIIITNVAIICVNFYYIIKSRPVAE